MPWSLIDFPETIRKTTVGRENQILSAEIQPVGRFPVVDQGQALIAGYSDAEERVIREDLPLVIFGDHTRCLKYVDVPFILGADGTKVLKPREELFDPKFFYYALLSLDIPNRGYNRHFTLLKEKKVPRPEKGEQRKIAGVLGVVQRAIEQQERLLQFTAELKKTLLHQLFTQGLRGEPQKQTEIGPVPESWGVMELGQISHKPEYGFTESAKPSGNAQFLRITDIQEDGVQWNGVPFCECPEELMERYLLADNDILFARIGATTGKNFLVKQPPRAVFASYLIRVRLKDTVSADFISQFCDTSAYWRQIDTNKGNNLKGGINSSTLKKLLVPVPLHRREQDEIAEILRHVDMKASRARRKRGVLNDLFRSMLHQFMTAQIRVKDVHLPYIKTAEASNK